jgi:hypothetical protein
VRELAENRKTIRLATESPVRWYDCGAMRLGHVMKDDRVLDKTTVFSRYWGRHASVGRPEKARKPATA